MTKTVDQIGPPLAGIPALENMQALAATMMRVLDDEIAVDRTPGKRACQETMRARQIVRRSLEEATLYSLHAIAHHRRHTMRPLTLMQSIDALPQPKRARP